MDDIVREVVISTGDQRFCAGDAVAARGGILLGSGLDLSEDQERRSTARETIE